MAIVLGSPQEPRQVTAPLHMIEIPQAGASCLQQGLDVVLNALRGDACVYFPIRHHSPACAWHLARLIRELRPASVLVEGPASFTPLIPAILDVETRAPVAIYTHYVDVDRKLYQTPAGEPDLGPARYAAYYPFCDYSPELVALRIGSQCGAKVEFIDLDYADQVLSERHAAERNFRPRIETLQREQHLQRSRYLKLLAERSGCRGFNEMWDHLFEADFRARSTDAFMREVAAYCYLARIDATQDALEAPVWDRYGSIWDQTALLTGWSIGLLFVMHALPVAVRRRWRRACRASQIFPGRRGSRQKPAPSRTSARVRCRRPTF